MSLVAFVLIVISAFLHAFWNFVSKRSNPTLAYFFITACSGFICVVPILIYFRSYLTQIPSSVWILVTLTGLAQAVYFSGLAGAYRHGDMSLAYPLARAIPVLAVALVSFLLGRGAQIGRLGLFGMVLITAGCIILPQKTFREIRWENYRGVVYIMTLVAALGTTSYTLIDDSIIERLDNLPALLLPTTQITLLFIAFQILSTAVMTGLVTLIQPKERQNLQAILKNRQLLWSGLMTGLIIMVAYGLVLAAMPYVRDVSYVAAFRQLSIPIGAVLGLTLQNEPRYKPKLVGIVVITVGLICVGLG